MEDNQSLAIVEGGRGQVAEARQRPPAPGPAKVGGEMVPTPPPLLTGGVSRHLPSFLSQKRGFCKPGLITCESRFLSQ